ncbi:MAG: hypothetical protein JWO05_941 [Gemmatimonadetes bacterium]|nr:hypothetical protein [Gemmatimonadota bacterium]
MGRTNIATTLGLSAAVLLAIAPVARAQQSVFSWAGRVDTEVQLTISGNNVTTSNIGRNESRARTATVRSALPREDGQVSIQTVEGRGNVDVIQQPSANNGYTAIVRIRDPQSGSAVYRLDGTWQSLGNSGNGYGRGRGNGNNGNGVGNGNGNNGNGNNGNGRAYGRRRQNQQSMQWSGDVDGDLLIRFRPNGINYRALSGGAPQNVQPSGTAIPQGATNVTLTVNDGRGSVTVTQQPSARNGYTTAIRVSDPQGGYGHYTFTVNWQ